MKDLYLSIKNFVLLNLTAIKHIDLWNEQLANIEDIPQFLRPALFVELGEVIWETVNKTQKKGTLQITIHLVSDCYDVNADDAGALEALDLLSEVEGQFDNLSFKNTTPFTAVGTVIDNNHGDLIHNTLSYTTELTLNITNRKKYVEATPDLYVTGHYK